MFHPGGGSGASGSTRRIIRNVMASTTTGLVGVPAAHGHVVCLTPQDAQPPEGPVQLVARDVELGVRRDHVADHLAERDAVIDQQPGGESVVERNRPVQVVIAWQRVIPTVQLQDSCHAGSRREMAVGREDGVRRAEEAHHARLRRPGAIQAILAR